METFAEARELVDDPSFGVERRRAVESLRLDEIDPPIRAIVAALAELPDCFTLQSCCGHFVHAAQLRPDNLERLPADDPGPVTYRIAYLALCLADTAGGRRLLDALGELPAIDPPYVQLGSPEWFWRQHVNAYAVQVEPLRFAGQDLAVVTHREALHLQAVRDRFLVRLAEIARSFREEQQTS